MKKLLFVIPMLLLFTTLINSQPRKNGPHPNFENLKLELNLTDEQAGKFETIFKQKMDEMKSVRGFFKEDRSAARDKTINITNCFPKFWMKNN